MEVSKVDGFWNSYYKSEEFKTICSFGRLATVVTRVVFDMYLNVSI
jgi:hypothetical protein